MPTSTAKKEKIAILGGGVGSMTTAWALTRQPAWQEKYEITIYQLGWRLGGKGACGRNADIGERIEEHGPHVWFGFYNTAFQMLRDCYQYLKDHNLTPDSPFQLCIPEAMSPLDHSSAMENVGGAWKPWHISFPPRPGTPGDPMPDVWEQLLYALDWLLNHEETIRQKGGANLEKIELRNNKFVIWLGKAYRFVCKVFGLEAAPPPTETKQESLLARVSVIAASPHVRERHVRPVHHRLLARLGDKLIAYLLGLFLKRLREAIADLLATNDDLRHAWQILDLGVTNVRGIFADDLLNAGFESINREDYSKWIERHGCSEPWSPLIEGLYDACFAFVDGDTAGGPGVRPKGASMEAGTTLRGMLQMFFGYCGSYSYKMQSGMGDTIFSPIYLALRDQGVNFKFFHCVKELTLQDRFIETIEMDVQATAKPSVLAQHPDGYQPLKWINGLPCWPNQPFLDQLVEGDQLKAAKIDLESAWSGWSNQPLTLRRGVDFDKVVLGISLGALPSICRQLIAADSHWAKMVREVRTVQTQSFQIWLKKTAEEMGWAVDPAGKQFDLMAGYVQPLDSFADMSQVLDKEVWPPAGKPLSVQYIFGPMAETEPMPEPGTKSDYPERKLAEAKKAALQYLCNCVHPLWPKGVSAADPMCLDWNLLVDPFNKSNEQRFDSQYLRVNVNPSERYVLSAAGTGKFRLAPGDSKFRNLVLAGDWTRNGFDVGCVEAGALSGTLAAAAIAAERGPKPQP
ncbi:MAG TPA: NAD(P)-binding protein [Terriglobales bacterium]|nr:NAD(P)-binding protein [Terriglobales bacterium]